MKYETLCADLLETYMMYIPNFTERLRGVLDGAITRALLIIYLYENFIRHEYFSKIID